MNAMSEQNHFAQVSLAAAEAILREGCQDFAFYLPSKRGEQPVLYSDAAGGIAAADLQRLHTHGVPYLHVRTSELRDCEAYLERRLADLISHPEIAVADKTSIVHQVGSAVARDLTTAPIDSPGLERATHLIDNVIGMVLHDSRVVSHMLEMAGHERSTASHMFMVSTLTVMLGIEFFGSDYELLRSLGTAGMMHDLGKLAISSEILNKATPLTSDEMALIHQHPIESVRLLGDHPYVTPAIRQMILQHHEWIDGRGYPLGLSGDEILPSTRMLSIADCFHAMIGRRSYRRSLTVEEANRALNAQAGRQFAPEVLKVWNDLLQRCTDQAGGELPLLAPASPCEGLPTRNEHRAAPKRRATFGSRPKRYTCTNQVRVQCYYAGRLADTTCAPDEFNALLHDISRGGMCLYSPYPMYRGEVIHVRIQQPGKMVWIKGLVSWCRQQDATTFRVGLRFLNRITEQEARDAAEVEGMCRTSEPSKMESNPVESLIRRPASDAAPKPMTHGTVLDALDAIIKTNRPTAEDERTASTASRSADAQVRLKAVAALTKIATKPARSALAALLQDQDRQVQEQAVAAAGALRMHEAQYLLRQLLLGDDTGMVLRAAAALGRLGDRIGLPVVVRALERDDDFTRLAAAAFGDIVGRRFAGNQHGVRAARNHLEDQRSTLLAIS